MLRSHNRYALQSVYLVIYYFLLLNTIINPYYHSCVFMTDIYLTISLSTHNGDYAHQNYKTSAYILLCSNITLKRIYIYIYICVCVCVCVCVCICVCVCVCICVCVCVCGCVCVCV